MFDKALSIVSVRQKLCTCERPHSLYAWQRNDLLKFAAVQTEHGVTADNSTLRIAYRFISVL